MADDINKALAAMNAMIGTAPVRVKVPTSAEMYASWQREVEMDEWKSEAAKIEARNNAAHQAAHLDGNPYPSGATGSTDWPEAPKGLNGPAGPQGMVIPPGGTWTLSNGSDAQLTVYAPEPSPYSRGTEEALRRALLHILGDMPLPQENAWERCRGIAAEALGYQRPAPMERPDNRPWPTRDNPLGEQRQRDPVTVGPRVEVTKKMIDAARLVTDEMGATDYISRFILEPIYRAMHAAAPVPLVSEAEDRIATLEGSRERWRNEVARLGRQACGLYATIDLRDAQIAMLHQALAAKDARIAELKSVLASTPVAFEDPDAKPVPVPGFLRAIREGNKAVVGLTTGRGDMPRGD